MAEAPAGTPTPTPEDTPKGGTSGEAKEDSVTVSAQFKKEALESWKPAAERANKLEEELRAKEAQLAELQRIAYGGGARQATDPTAEMVAKLREQASFGDVTSEAALLSLQRTAIAEAEVWLANALHRVPESKREKVAGLIRLSNYQMSPEQALSTVSDPEAEAQAKKLAELQAENDRLRNVKPNGASPAATPPASVSDDRGEEDIKQSDYVAILRAGGPKALDLKRAVGEGRKKLRMGE